MYSVYIKVIISLDTVLIFDEQYFHKYITPNGTKQESIHILIMTNMIYLRHLEQCRHKSYLSSS